MLIKNEFFSDEKELIIVDDVLRDFYRFCHILQVVLGDIYPEIAYDDEREREDERISIMPVSYFG